MNDDTGGLAKMSDTVLDINSDEQKERVNDVRLRLSDIIAGLGPHQKDVTSESVHDALAQLAVVQRELRLVLHCQRLEETGLDDQVAKFEAQLAKGRPRDAQPVDEMIASLKEEFGLA